MTTEVLMLNKDAVVIAADSAVTTGRDPHPRYSKAANKIFDVSIHGNVAATIFAAAEIDCVPWELVLKQFRRQESGMPPLPRLDGYVGRLVNYLQVNGALFPALVRENLLEQHFYEAAGFLLRRIGAMCPTFIDVSKTPAERVDAWEIGKVVLAQDLAARTYQTPLTLVDHQNILTKSAALEAELTKMIASSVDYSYADPVVLTALAIEALVKQPTEFLSYTGLVFAGYGAEEIFPSFVHIEIYGHIGEVLLWREANRYAITHQNDAFILPFAQSSMIDRFTDGFDSKLSKIIYQESLLAFDNVISDLSAAGVDVPADLSRPIIEKRQNEFMSLWKNKNWEVNFHPLRRVLNSLSVPEMGHLAESLLVLEELRERVTSPSESVGGPIDVAVITKSEGLLWLKRKHFFDSRLNPRYIARTKSDYNFGTLNGEE